MIYVNTSCTPTIVEVKNKSQFDYQIGVEAQGYIYVEGNTTRAFLLELLVSQIRLLLTHGASQTAHLRRVCNTLPVDMREKMRCRNFKQIKIFLYILHESWVVYF